MEAFELYIPSKIYFGRGILRNTFSKIAQYLDGNIMVVTTGRSLIRLGFLQILLDGLKEVTTVKEIIVYDDISANPKLREVQKAIEIGISSKISAVIGFGGGSALDAAKAVAAGTGMGERIEKFFYEGMVPSELTLPIIAVPTTAGTGSELSKAAILTDNDKKVKSGIRGEALYPKAAIVDTELTEKIPYHITMETGFDVLAHAVESYLSLAANPFTRMQSEYAIELVGVHLVKLSQNLENIDARAHMSYASMLMGINLGNASTCLPHRMQYPLGAHTDSSHGAGLAALYPAWLECSYQYSEDKWNKVIELLTGEKCPSKIMAVNKMKEFLRSLKLPAGIHELNVGSESIPQLSLEVTGNLRNDPAAIEENIVYKIYEMSM